jgi:hypothetical protein
MTESATQFSKKLRVQYVLLDIFSKIGVNHSSIKGLNHAFKKCLRARGAPSGMGIF